MASFMQANGQRIVQMTQRAGAPMSLSVHATNAMAVGAVAAGKQIEELFSRQLYQALNLGLIPPSRLKAANRQIAELSQQAIVDGWRQRLPVRSPPYRRGPDPNKDRLSQLLGPALAREDMLRATTARTISFLNVSTLNREARHWYRVNYGAEGPKVSPPRPRPVPVTVNGNTLFTLQDPNLPMPNSWLPRAFISENDMFFSPSRARQMSTAAAHERRCSPNWVSGHSPRTSIRYTARCSMPTRKNAASKPNCAAIASMCVHVREPQAPLPSLAERLRRRRAVQANITVEVVERKPDEFFDRAERQATEATSESGDSDRRDPPHGHLPRQFVHSSFDINEV